MANVAVNILLKAKDQASSLFKSLKGTVDGVKSSVFSLNNSLAALGVSLTGAAVVGYLVKVNREYGKLLTQLETFQGSRAGAEGVFADLAKFAAETPFQIEETVKAFTTLRSAGITPTKESLRLFGDQAAAFGGSIVDFAEAVRAATTGEMERLKQFGVVARLQGEHLSVTFNGQTKVIGRSADAITRYLEDLSRTNFAGGMERQAKTLDGAISNLEDAIASLARAAGDAGFTDLLTDWIRGLTDFVTGLTNNQSALHTWAVAARDEFALVGASIRRWSAEWELGLASAQRNRLSFFGTGETDPAKSHGIIAANLARLENAQRAVDQARADEATALKNRDTHFAFNSKPDAAIDALSGGDLMSQTGKGGLADTGHSLASAQTTAPAGGANAKTALEKELDTLKAQLETGKNLLELNRDRTKGEEDLAQVASRALGLYKAGHLSKKDEKEVTDLLLSVEEARTADLKRQQELKDKDLDTLEKQAQTYATLVELGNNRTADARTLLSIEQDMSKIIADRATSPEVRARLLASRAQAAKPRRDSGLLTPEEQVLANAPKGVAAEQQRIAAAASGLAGPPTDNFTSKLANGLNSAIGAGQTLDQVLADMTTNTFQSFGSAVEGAFGAMVDGSQSAGDAFKSVMLGALAGVESGFGSFFLQQAVGETAAAFAALSNPLTAAGAPGHFKAAAGYTAAATGMFALSGAMSGAGRKAAGGSASGGAAAGAASSTSNLNNDTRGDATLVIEGGFLNMDDPRQEAQLARALEALSGRRVTIKR